MILATAYWSPWIRVPAYIVGIIIFGGLGLYGLSLLMGSEREQKNKRSRVLAYVLLALVFLGARAYFAAWNEKRVIAAFAELLIAHTLYCGAAIGSIAGGWYVGYRIYKKTAMQWVGWVVGVLIGSVISATIWGLCSEIPGVGWRMEQISEDSEEVDYDYY